MTTLSALRGLAEKAIADSEPATNNAERGRYALPPALEVCRAIAAIEAAIEGQGRQWLPISEAPKDGTDVLACGVSPSGSFHRYGIAFYNDSLSLGGYGPWRWLCTFQPTHYMPLPPPPS